MKLRRIFGVPVRLLVCQVHTVHTASGHCKVSQHVTNTVLKAVYILRTSGGLEHLSPDLLTTAGFIGQSYFAWGKESFGGGKSSSISISTPQHCGEQAPWTNICCSLETLAVSPDRFCRSLWQFLSCSRPMVHHNDKYLWHPLAHHDTPQEQPSDAHIHMFYGTRQTL